MPCVTRVILHNEESAQQNLVRCGLAIRAIMSSQRDHYARHFQMITFVTVLSAFSPHHS